MRSLYARSLLSLLALCPLVEAQPSAEELKRKLPESDALTVRAGKLWLTRFQVVGLTDEGDPLVGTPQWRAAVSADVLEYKKLEALGRLAALVEVARRGDVPTEGLVLHDSPLFGPHLRSDEHWVLAEGIAKRATPEDRPGNDAVEAARSAVAAFATALERSEANELARKAILQVAAAACEYTAEEDDIVGPEFARRAVRNGWLEETVGATAEVKAVVLAVEKAQHLAKVEVYRGDGIEIAKVENAYGDEAWILTSRTRSGYLRPLPPPEYFEDAPTFQLAVGLRGGSDPLAARPEPVWAHVIHDEHRIATWSKDKGFRSDVTAWRKAIPEDEEFVPDCLPPHVTIMSMTGHVLRLVTAHGSLTPSSDGSERDLARFVAEAAKALPSAAYLDLIGEVLFRYVNDSPDPARPLLIGTEDASGEIHQTVSQTLSTSLGGICRGDCDDLAEVYHAILTSQGKLPHIMNLPAHNALGWVEKVADGFRTYVLQTGPPLAFTAETVQESLKEAYTSFGAGDAFDPNQCQIAVRFLGENLRSNWGLGYRIFLDADYARTMIDVQKDWHFSTFRRGVAKMEKIVQGGDNDPANIHELAGLANATGQWKLAAGYMRQILAISDDPTFQLRMGIVANHLELEEDDIALAAAKELITKDLPKAKPDLGEDWYPIALTAASNLLYESEERDLSVSLALEVGRHYMTRIRQLDTFLGSPRFDRNVWEQDEEITQVRLFLQGYVSTVSGFFHEHGEEVQDNPRIAQLIVPLEIWLARIGFHDIHEPGENLARYATVGAYYRAMIGWSALRAALAECGYATEKGKDHTDRMLGLLQFKQDLPWIKSSVSFWAGAISYLFRKEAKTLDVGDMVSLARELEGAYAATSRLGLQSLVFDESRFGIQLGVALVTKDEKTVREKLRHVGQLDDAGLRGITMNWVSAIARFSDLKWYRRVMEIWKDEVDYKPDWFALAWAVKLSKAPQHALLIADMAVAAYPKDRAFAEERDFMRSLLAKK